MKKKCYKVEFNGSYLISEHLPDIMSTIENEVEQLDPLDDPTEVLFSTVELTQEEIDNLPEFDGF